jgi:hypothetical protein
VDNVTGAVDITDAWRERDGREEKEGRDKQARKGKGKVPVGHRKGVKGKDGRQE